MRRQNVLRLFVLGFVAVAGMVGAGAPGARQPVFLLDSDHHPHVRIRWTCKDGSTTSLEGDREYQAPNDRTALGKNVSCYVALGGNRGDYGLGHAGAVDVRVGFYKVDKKKLFFENLADETPITMELTGVQFNQPARALPATMVQHLKYEDPNNVLGCAGAPDLLATWNTYSKNETLGGRLTRRNGRVGVLGPENDTGASVTFSSDGKGVVSMVVVIPYKLFKHADDPWLLNSPGDFVEPVHFHLEFEAFPKDAPDPPEPTPVTPGNQAK